MKTNAPRQFSFYGKMLFLYSGIFLLSSIIMTSLLFYSQHKNQLEVQDRNSQSALAQFQIYTEQYILSQVYDIANNKIYNNSLNSENILFNSESYAHNFNDFDDILDIYAFFSDIASNSAVIDSFYVYDKKNDTFVSTKKGCFYFITNRRYDYQDILPYALLDYADRQAVSQFWIPPTVFHSYSGNYNMISLVITLPIFTEPDKADFMLFINLDITSIYQEYFQGFDTADSEILVLSGQNDILYSTNPLRLSSGALPENFASDWKVHSAVSSSNDWTYMYFSPKFNPVAAVFSSAGSIFLLSLAVSLLCLFGIYFVSNRLYRPIARLVKYSRQSSLAESSDIKSADELSVLDAAFRNMTSHINKLQQTVDKNNSLLISNTIKELLSGAVFSHGELNGRLELTNHSMPFAYFYLLCIRPNETVYGGLDYQKKSFLQISIADRLSTWSFDGPGFHTQALSVFHHSGDFTTVINSDDKNGYPAELLADLLDDLCNEYGNILNMAISPVITDFADFPKVRSTLLGYFKYSYIYGYHNIFTPECIAEYENNALVRAQAPLKLLQTQMKRHDAEGIKREIAVLFQQSKQGKNSLLYTYNLSLQIINLICSECDNLDMHAEELSHPYLIDSFSKIQNLEDTVSWFYQITDLFISLWESRNSSLDASLIPAIVEYMSQNVNQQLSLNSVADRFGISAGHLSRMFKEKQGVHFSDYLIRLKLESATHMLVKNPSMKVNDIATELGYSNISYFNKMFKEYFGMTPTQYRQKNSSFD